MKSIRTASRFTVANFWADPVSGVSYNLQVQIPQTKTTSIEDLKNVPVSTGGGKMPSVLDSVDTQPWLDVADKVTLYVPLVV